MLKRINQISGYAPIRVQIKADWLKQAQAHKADMDKQMTKRYGNKDGNVWQYRTPDAHMVGKLGELAFNQVLIDHDIRHNACPNNPKYFGDDGDFHVYRNGELRRVDVKTASNFYTFEDGAMVKARDGKHHNCEMPTKQFEAIDNIDLYIGARLDGAFVEIHGFVFDRSDFKQHPARDVVYILLNRMYPIKLLLDNLDVDQASLLAKAKSDAL